MNDNKVINLQQRKEDSQPHIEGPAKCVGCGHRHHAVALSGTWQMECPACHMMKAVWCFPVDASGERWVCKCGNDLFHATPTGVLCANCGTRTIYGDM